MWTLPERLVTGVPRDAEQVLAAVVAPEVAALEGVDAEGPRRPVEGLALLLRSRLVAPAAQAAAWEAGGPSLVTVAAVAEGRAERRAASAVVTLVVGVSVSLVSALLRLADAVAFAQKQRGWVPAS